MNPRTPSPSARPILRGDPIATVIDLTPCPGCGYELKGQSIIHEPVYGHHAVQCPECGRIVVVGPERVRKSQERGSWQAIGLIYLVGLGTFILVTMGARWMREASIPWATQYGRILARMHSPEPAIPLEFETNNEFEMVSAAWFDAQDHQAVLTQHGGWMTFIDWPATAWCWCGGVMFIAVACATLLVAANHHPRWVQAVWLGLVLSLATYGVMKPSQTPTPGRPAAQSVVGFTRDFIRDRFDLVSFVLLVAIVVVVWLLVGPVARWAIVRYGKPASWSTFSGLWTRSGMEAPKPTTPAGWHG